ncbi:MAG: DUF2889 domain-containing protein [Firmicutes bacterium]|nr:DUF2889 domain-containing protein [Bacillota bacterium]
MEVLRQSSFYTMVKRGDNRLQAETIYLSTSEEAVGWIEARTGSLLIEDAGCSVLRRAGEQVNEAHPLPGLIGAEAHLGAGSEIARVVSRDDWLKRELMNECVKGIIQAETFLFSERGYASLRDYENYWKQYQLNSCRRFSHLERTTRGWADHVGVALRDTYLFNRSKTCSVSRGMDGEMEAVGSFIDSFHEMGGRLSLSPEGRITGCSANLLRAPDRVCFEGPELLSPLVGQNVRGLGKKQVALLAGGRQNCTHLIDLVYELCRASAEAVGVT